MRKVPVVLQSEAAECGIACLAMIAGAFGRRMDLPAMRRHYTASLKGMTLRDLIRVANEVRLHARPLRGELESLDQLRLPCILHWGHNHFVVLTRVGKRQVIINDPSLGQRRVSMREVSRQFTGVAVELWPDEQFSPGDERSRVRIWDLMRKTSGFTGAATQILLLSFALELIVIAMPIAFQIVLDDVIVSMDHSLLTLVAIGLVCLLAFRVLSEFTRSWSILAMGARLTLQWKMSLFSHLLKLPLDFFERRHVGDLASRFTSIDVMQKTLSMGPIATLVDGLMGPLLVVMMFLYSPLLAAIALCSTGIYAAARIIFYRHYRRVNEEAIVFAAKENSHFIESLRGMPSIKSLHLLSGRHSAWSNFLADRVNAEFRVQRIDVLFSTLSNALFGIDRILIIVLGADAIMANRLSVGMLIAFLAYKDQFSHRLSRFLDTLSKLALLSVHSERIAEVALAEPERLVSPAIIRLTEVPAGTPVLSAQALRFRYGDNEPDVIGGMDFNIGQGECVAITGPSGSGKTTLLKLLAGLLQPQSGSILLHDVPVRAIGLAAYRCQIGCVLQDDRLFSGSIIENIAGFADKIDYELAEHAARLAAIHQEIVHLPMGYGTLVGDMGNTLSGGQIQRVVLARALYRRPRVLLLDEATSHLDEANEQLINRAIRALTIPRVIVAHRRSTIEMADRVFRISDATPAITLSREPTQLPA